MKSLSPVALVLLLTLPPACGGDPGTGSSTDASTSQASETSESGEPTGTTGEPTTAGPSGSDSDATTDATTTTATTSDATTSDSDTSETTDEPTTSTTDATTDPSETDTDTDTGGVVYEELTCVLVLACAEPCEDEACYEACLELGSEIGAGEAHALVLCDIENMCNGDEQCLEANCGDELFACYSGPLTCPEMIDCLDFFCDPGYEGCELNCLYEGTFDDQPTFGELFECAVENGCFDAECTNANCPDEVAACFM